MQNRVLVAARALEHAVTLACKTEVNSARAILAIEALDSGTDGLLRITRKNLAIYLQREAKRY